MNIVLNDINIEPFIHLQVQVSCMETWDYPWNTTE